MTEPTPSTPEPRPATEPARAGAGRERLAGRFPHLLDACRAAGVSIPELDGPTRAA